MYVCDVYHSTQDREEKPRMANNWLKPVSNVTLKIGDLSYRLCSHGVFDISLLKVSCKKYGLCVAIQSQGLLS